MSRDFVVHVVELMTGWAPVRARRMFGGHGIYRGARMFALVAGDVLYLKADTVTQPRFVAAGSSAFVYEGSGRRVAMRYWRAPATCLEEPAAMHAWCALAWAAACRAAAAAPPSRRRFR